MAFSGCSSYVRVIFFIKLNMGSSNWKVVIPGVCKRLDTAFQTVPDTGCRGAKKQLCKDSQAVPGLQKKRGSETHKRRLRTAQEEAPEHIKRQLRTAQEKAPELIKRRLIAKKKTGRKSRLSDFSCPLAFLFLLSFCFIQVDPDLIL
jgi:hypothetical protein